MLLGAFNENFKDERFGYFNLSIVFQESFQVIFVISSVRVDFYILSEKFCKERHGNFIEFIVEIDYLLFKLFCFKECFNELSSLNLDSLFARIHYVKRQMAHKCVTATFLFVRQDKALHRHIGRELDQIHQDFQ